MMVNILLLTLIYKGNVYQIKTSTDKYKTLRDLVRHQLSLPGFGLCGGLGTCGTCMIEIGEKFSPTRYAICCDMPVELSLSNSIIIISP